LKISCREQQISVRRISCREGRTIILEGTANITDVTIVNILEVSTNILQNTGKKEQQLS